MKLVVLISALVVPLASTGCATVRSNLRGDFEDSNQRFLEDTLQELPIVETVSAVVPTGSQVAIVSMEEDESSDHPIATMVEDTLIPRMIDGGYTVLERDQDMLRRLASEQGAEGFELILFPRGETTVEKEGGTGYFSGGLASAWGQSRSTTVRSTSEPREGIQSIQTTLHPADFVLSYRVLELGILYGASNAKEKTTEREGLARVHLRVHDVESGRVALATNLSASLKDSIDSRMLDSNANFHWSFFGNAQPMTQGIPTGKKTLVKSVEATGNSTTSSSAAPRVAVAILGGAIIAVLLSTQ